MKRRNFFKLLGIGTVAIATAPKEVLSGQKEIPLYPKPMQIPHREILLKEGEAAFTINWQHDWLSVVDEDNPDIESRIAGVGWCEIELFNWPEKLVLGTDRVSVKLELGDGTTLEAEGFITEWEIEQNNYVIKVDGNPYKKA